MIDVRVRCLEVAQQHPKAIAQILGWAKNVSSAEAVEEIIATAGHDKHASEKWQHIGKLVFILALVILTAEFMSIGSFILNLPNLALAMCPPIICCIAGFTIEDLALSSAQRFNFVTQWMRPIAGTELCVEAAHYVSAGNTHALAWRDLALAERGQLYAFDVEIMRYIFESESPFTVIENACRVAHGVPHPQVQS